MANEKIKYDGSQEEEIRLGFVTPDGVVVTNKRQEYNLYLKECRAREEYRNDKELISLGIVDKYGKVLDENRLKEIKEKRLDSMLIKQENESEQKINKPGLFKRAFQKILSKKHNKSVLEKATENER